MHKNFLRVFLQVSVVATVLVGVLAGCDVDEPMMNSAENSSAKAQNDDVPGRLVSLYLEPQRPTNHSPVFAGRLVVAEPVYTVPASMARAQGLTDGVDVVYVGKSCKSLLARYPDLYDCVEEETQQLEYGDAESSAATNSDGFASILLGGAEKYRLRVQSWATEEDAKCFWGGEETIGNRDSEVKIPLLVFCE